MLINKMHSLGNLEVDLGGLFVCVWVVFGPIVGVGAFMESFIESFMKPFMESFMDPFMEPSIHDIHDFMTRSHFWKFQDPRSMTKRQNSAGVDPLTGFLYKQNEARIRRGSTLYLAFFINKEKPDIANARKLTQPHATARKRMQTHANARKRTQPHANACKRTQTHTNARKRRQTHANAGKRTQTHAT